MTNRRVIGCTALAACLVAGALPAHAVEGTDAAVPRGDVEALTATLDEIAALLRASVDGDARYRRLELAIACLQFRSRRVEGLERELRDVEADMASVEETLQRRRAQLDELASRAGLDSGDDAQRTARMKDQLRTLIGSQEARLDRLERTALDLENDIADGRRQLQRFEDYVLEHLDLEE